MVEGTCRFDGGPASGGSVSRTAVAKEAVKELVVEDDCCGAAAREVEEEEMENDHDDGEGEEGKDLELGLTLGAARSAKRPARRGPRRRILTAKDLPSLASLASPSSPSASSVSSSSGISMRCKASTCIPRMKRAAETVSPDAGASSSPHPPSQVVVGWPPIRSFRMNSLFHNSKDITSETDAATAINKTNVNKNQERHKDQMSRGTTKRSSFFVKVKMDGDPIGRKVDLNAHRSYESLAVCLEFMFQKPTMTPNNIPGPVYGTKVLKLLDSSSDLVLTYEDRDGDWMLVGDVPWGMFLETVTRLRIMRTSDETSRCLSFKTASGFIGNNAAATILRNSK